MHGYKGFFFVVKTFKITLFQLSTMQFSVINWGHNAIYYIPELSYFVAESLCLLTPFTHFAFPPPPTAPKPSPPPLSFPSRGTHPTPFWVSGPGPGTVNVGENDIATGFSGRPLASPTSIWGL